MPIEGGSLPPVDLSSLPGADSMRGDEEKAFARGGQVLDRGLRRIAGYGALVIAGVLYLVGLCLAVKFSRAVPIGTVAPSWHIVAATLAALFTVPTVLVLAVLRSASIKTKDAEADSLHAAIGTKVMAVLDKFIDGAVKS